MSARTHIQTDPERGTVSEGPDAGRGGPRHTAGPRLGPPDANRGGVTPFEGLEAAWEAWRGVDYCTATIPVGLAESIIAAPPGPIRHMGAGSGKAEGFRASEVYQILGGTLYRRVDAVSPSKRWGRAYESWEASGAAGGVLAEWLAPHATELRVSRLDMAVDVSCSAKLSPRDVFAGFADLEAGKAPGGGDVAVRGKGHHTNHTYYVGQHGAPRSLRMYRKDIQSPMLYGDHDINIMRVELEFSKPNAHPMFAAWARDDVSAWAAWGRHLYDMTGCELLPIGDLPPVERAANVEVLQTMLEMVEQYGPYMDMAHEAGIDLVSLAKIRSDRKSPNRMTKARKASRRAAFDILVEYMGADAIERYIADRLLQRNAAAVR